MAELPTVVTTAGLQPISPTTLRAMLVTLVSQTNPDYTANLPGTLIEDIASTDVGALVIMDQFRVEFVNSLTPYGANAFLLNQLGQIYGVPLGQTTNTSVEVVFSGTDQFDQPAAGLVVARGFVVSDGTYHYQIVDGAVLDSSGSSGNVTARATQSGSFSVPANTVNQLVTSAPPDIVLAVNNPFAGTPGLPGEDETSYRPRVLEAGLAASQGMTRYLRTLLKEVPGVVSRLVSIRQQIGGGWEVIVGGGDDYEVAAAIFESLFDISTLVGSIMSISDVSKANPGVVTTFLNHGLSTGTVVNITGVLGPTAINNTPLTITVTGEKTFQIGVDTSSLPSYVSGGVVTPNLRNVVVSVNDYPDTYAIPFVRPPQQIVTVVATWNTVSASFVADGAISQAAGPALVNYVNSIVAGQGMNLFVMASVFQAAIADIMPIDQLTRLVFSVSINGISTPAESGTGIIAGDPESYFQAEASGVVVTRG